MDQRETQKRRAGESAAELVESGMRVGLGTGSTVRFFIEQVALRIAQGEVDGVSAVPTSRATSELALRLGIAIIDLDGPLDVAVDGADQVAADLSLMKGGGGALLREKIVAAAADRFVVIADIAKAVDRLGAGFRLPVEMTRFGCVVTLNRLAEFGNASLRGGEHPFLTDNGNYIVDVDIGEIADPAGLDLELCAVPGVVGTGLFVGMADLVIFGDDYGTVERSPT